MTRTGLLRSRKAEIVLGVGLFVAGSLLLRDAWEGRRGPGSTPWPLRPFSWW